MKRAAVPERVRVEQMRLLLANLQAVTPQTVLLLVLVLWALLDAGNRFALLAWAGAVVALEFFSAWDARRSLARLSGATLPALARRQMGLSLLDGLLWAGLVWITLDRAGLGGSVLVIGVVAGVAASAMASLAVVMPVFVGFLVTLAGGVAVKLWLMKDPAYGALAVAGVLFCLTLVGHGRTLGRTARAAIALRFENLELIERLRAESELARAAHRVAEESNLAKARFLAAASHDLRQPIHAQGLFLGALERSPLQPAQRNMLQSAISATQATAEMLDTLLDFSRIEAGVVRPAVRPFRLQPLLHEIENELAPQADAKGIAYRSRETSLIVLSDPVILALIVRNLVSNAIRYTERGGLLVACRRRGARVVVEVWDTGIGIHPDDREAVFREFHQLGNPERDRRKGLGLGLNIARGMAQALGHVLTLASEPGRGSVFRVELPLSAVQALPAPGPQPVEGPVAGARVLVIDDDEVVRAGMRHVLADWGCDCDMAADIRQALDIARLRCPDVVISDYRLQGQATGAEAIAALRAEHGPALPALLVTGDTAPQRLRDAAAVGVPLLHKPLRPRELRQALATALQASRAPATA